MLRPYLLLALFMVTAPSWAVAQQSSGLVGTWVGKVQGYGVEMKLVLHANGSADYEGVAGSWRAQGNRLLLTQEGETVAYTYRRQGFQFILSGGDLMAPLVLLRLPSAAPTSAGAAAPSSAQEAGETLETAAPAVGDAGNGTEAPRPVRASQPAARKRALAESEVIQLLEGGVPSRRLIDLVEERGVAFRVTPTLASKLKAKGGTEELIATLHEAGGTQSVTSASATKPSPSTGLAALGSVAGGQYASAAPPARSPAAARGRPSSPGGPRYTQDQWGLSFVVPPNWKVADRKTMLLLGSDTEAGLILVRFVRRTTLKQLSQEYGEGMQEEGLQLMPLVQPQSFPAGGNRALAGELAGVAQDGARLRARVVAVASPFGDAAVVLGLTTEEKYPGLKPPVEALAASVSFTQPRAAPVNEAVAGQYAYFYSSSVGGSYSRQDLLNLCSDGRFNRGGQIYSSGNAGIAAGQSGNAGQWSADGDENQGIITLIYNNGQTDQIQYQKSGADIILDGKKYGRYGDGSCTERSPFE